MRRQFMLVSSFQSLPQRDLVGYCFAGADLVIGSAGYDRYFRQTGRLLLPGMDGAYVSLNRLNGMVTIGTDALGYQKLFYYSDGRHWATSNSLFGLAEFVRSWRLSLTLNKAHLASWFIKGPFGSQLVSYRTCYNEIRLIPAHMEIVIDENERDPSRRFRVQESGQFRREFEGANDYPAALVEFMASNIGRLETALNDQSSSIVADLTGGRDSRLVLALLLAAGGRSNQPLSEVDFRSGLGAPDDLSVAERIADRYGLVLNSERAGPNRRPRHGGPIDAYGYWKYTCLGVYGPVYFPTTHEKSDEIFKLGGQGGECYRKFYAQTDPKRFVKRKSAAIRSPKLVRAIARDVVADLKMLSDIFGPTIHPMVLHYQNFRARCHGARRANYGLSLAPLASRALRNCVRHLSPDFINTSQLYVDAMSNLDPELLMMAYDDNSKKTPRPENLSAVVDVRDRLAEALNQEPGRVYRGVSAEEEPFRFGTPSPPDDEAGLIGRMLSDFDENASRAKKTALFSSEYVEKARASLSQAAFGGGFAGERRETRKAVHIILAGEAVRLTR